MLSDAIDQFPAALDQARDVWEAITRSRGETAVGKAVEDTTPAEYTVLLTVEDIAAAFAVQCQVWAFQGATPATPAECRKLAHKGWEAFLEIAKMAGDRKRSTGCDSAAAWPIFKDFRDLSEDDRDKAREIAKLAGRMTVSLRGAMARKVKGIPESVAGVKRGNRFRDLHRTEIARLGRASLKRDLLDRVSRNRGVCVEREGSERKARGPLVFLLDESGSMAGDRDTWAKAAMTALTRVAWADKRDCAVVHFSTASKVSMLRVNDHQALMRAQTLFLDGGTNIHKALCVGLATVKDLAKKGITGADIVLVSDGTIDSTQRVVCDRALKRCEAEKVRLWTVAVGRSYETDNPLRSRAAGYQEVHDPNDPNNVNKLSAAV